MLWLFFDEKRDGNEKMDAEIWGNREKENLPKSKATVILPKAFHMIAIGNALHAVPLALCPSPFAFISRTC